MDLISVLRDAMFCVGGGFTVMTAESCSSYTLMSTVCENEKYRVIQKK